MQYSNKLLPEIDKVHRHEREMSALFMASGHNSKVAVIYSC